MNRSSTEGTWCYYVLSRGIFDRSHGATSVAMLSGRHVGSADRCCRPAHSERYRCFTCKQHLHGIYLQAKAMAAIATFPGHNTATTETWAPQVPKWPKGAAYCSCKNAWAISQASLLVKGVSLPPTIQCLSAFQMESSLPKGARALPCLWGEGQPPQSQTEVTTALELSK